MESTPGPTPASPPAPQSTADVALPAALPIETAPALRPIDRIRRAYNRSLHRIEVPEWADEATGQPFAVYFGVLTQADFDVLKTAAEEMGGTGSGGGLDARSLRLLIHKALGEDGKPLFTMGDYEYLRTEVPIGVLQRLVTFMWKNGTLTPTEAKDAVKNSSGSATT